MAKNEQFIPLTEEQQEDKDLINKADKLHGTFVPSEELPDDAPLPDQFEEKEKQREAMFEDDDIVEGKIEDLKKEIYFHQGEGVASVGPDVEVSGEEVLVDNARVNSPIEISDKELHEDKSLREKVSAITAERNPWERNRRVYQKRIENLKTASKSKKERGLRAWLGKLLRGEVKTEPMIKEEKMEANEYKDVA